MFSNELEEEELIADGELEDKMTYMSDTETICAICYAEFLDPEDLRIHIDQVHKGECSFIRKCQFCSEEYSDDLQYAEHLRDFHIASLKSCSYCWRVFDDHEAHRKHSNMHIKNKTAATFSCSQCQLSYGDLHLLRKHEYDYHYNSKFDGLMLHEVFPYLSAVLKVKCVTFIEAMGSDVVYSCNGCDFTTVDIHSYLKHAKSNKCKVYVCNSCCNVFNKKKSIVKHARTNCNIFGLKERITQLCLDCNTHIAVSKYAKHKNNCKPIKCYVCNITFQNMYEWSEHQSTTHSNVSVQVETCQYCWKRCVGRVAMQKHIDKTHRPEFHLYKYLCIYCESLFKHPQKLFAHFVSQHKNINPYTCKICDKTFHIRKKFTIHIKLIHNSVGFVEFDEKYHVFFTDKKSENPFIPKSLYVDDVDSGKALCNSEGDLTEMGNTNVTETEGNQTETENKKKHKLKRKRISKGKMVKRSRVHVESSDDSEPLLALRRRVRIQKKKEINIDAKKKQSNKDLFTCKVCNKYCYTYQNYNHHISLHSKCEDKKCIKCSQSFKSTSKLNEHIATKHSTSKLTETLKTLLEKRKTGGSLSDDLPKSEKFRRTIKKTTITTTSSSAKITAVNPKLSVQKFLENFIPEDTKTDIPLDTNISIKLVTGPPRKPAVRMTAFKPSSNPNFVKIAMPVKFVDHYPQQVKLSLKVIEAPRLEEEHDNYSDHSTHNPNIDKNVSIPEVAEEVMLEESEEILKNQNDIGHKLVLPKTPIAIKDLKIAHLLPEAPFYKIVKMTDVLNQQKGAKKNEPYEPPKSIKLPDGTKLVTANPLAHLLGNDSEKVMQAYRSKYYTSKNKNFPSMLTKALTMLEKPNPTNKRKNDFKKKKY